MTGLDPSRHVIVEIATIVTDDELDVVGDGLDLVVHQPPEALAEMDDVVREMHTSSGLLEAIEASEVSLADAGERTLDLIKLHVPEPSTVPLCGNSIGTDRRFLAAYLPADRRALALPVRRRVVHQGARASLVSRCARRRAGEGRHTSRARRHPREHRGAALLPRDRVQVADLTNVGRRGRHGRHGDPEFEVWRLADLTDGSSSVDSCHGRKRNRPRPTSPKSRRASSACNCRCRCLVSATSTATRWRTNGAGPSSIRGCPDRSHGRRSSIGSDGPASRMRNVHTVVVTHSHVDHFGASGRLREQAGANVVTSRSFRTWWDPTDAGERRTRSRRWRHGHRGAARSSPAVGSTDALGRQAPAAAAPCADPLPAGAADDEAMVRHAQAERPLGRRRGHRVRQAGVGRRAHARPHARSPVPLRPRRRRAALGRSRAADDHAAHLRHRRRSRPARARSSHRSRRSASSRVSRWCLPAHGHPFDDLRGRVKDIERHHEERLARLREATNELGRGDRRGAVAVACSASVRGVRWRRARRTPTSSTCGSRAKQPENSATARLLYSVV